MAWLEITLQTAGENIESTAAALTAAGFSDLVMEDQGEFESFLEGNREYWDYSDEDLQQHLQGLSQIKLYLEDTDDLGLQKLQSLAQKLSLPMTVAPLAETDW